MDIIEIEKKLEELHKKGTKTDKVISFLKLGNQNISETIKCICDAAIDRKNKGTNARVLFWGLCKLKQEVESSPKLKTITIDSWGDWEKEFGFSYQLLHTFPNPKKDHFPDIKNYLGKRPEFRNNAEIQKQIISYIPQVILTVIAEDEQLPNDFQEKIKRQCQESKPKKPKKDSATQIKPLIAEKVDKPKDILNLLTALQEQPQSKEYLEDITSLVQETEDDYIICHYLTELSKGKHQFGFNILMDAVSDVSGEDKIYDFTRLILSGSDNEVQREMLIEYISYISTEKRESKFNFGDFIDFFLKEPMNRELRNFLSDVCQRVSEFGREGCKKARILQNKIEAYTEESADSLVYKLGDSFSSLEALIINMGSSEELSVRNVANELVDKIYSIYCALEELGVLPVADVRDWIKQTPIKYDRRSHDLREEVELGADKNVKLNSIGLKSKHSEAIVRAKVHAI